MFIGLHVGDELVDVHLHDRFFAHFVRCNLGLVNVLALYFSSLVVDTEGGEVINEELGTFLCLWNHEVEYPGLLVFDWLEDY